MAGFADTLRSARVVSSGWRLLPFLLLLVLPACGAVRHGFEPQTGTVLPAEARFTVGEIANVSGETFEEDVITFLREALVRKLRENRLYHEGEEGVPQLVITARIVDYEPGNAFKRWLLPGFGSTVLSVEGEVTDPESGRILGSFDARRTISWGGGYSVGAWKWIFDWVADDIVDDILAARPAATS